MTGGICARNCFQSYTDTNAYGQFTPTTLTRLILNWTQLLNRVIGVNPNCRQAPITLRPRWAMGCLHDEANMKQTYSKSTCTTCALSLLHVGFMFVSSCKHPITQRNFAAWCSVRPEWQCLHKLCLKNLENKKLPKFGDNFRLWPQILS